MANLLHHFAAAVDRHPHRIAIIDGKGRETSFAQLQNRAQRLAAYWYEKGIRNGDRVLMAMPVNADLYASLAALWSLGATVVLPEPAMGIAGLRHAAATTQPKAFCASGFFAILKFVLPEIWAKVLLRPYERAAMGKVIDPSDSDIALISFTSGTTGKPKAIPRSHGFLMAQFDAISPLLYSDEPQRDLVAFPVFTLINIACGQTSVLPNWKMSRLEGLSQQQISQWFTKQEISRALLPPSICAKLTQAPVPPQLHTIYTGGGPVFPDIVQDLRRNEGLRVVSIYGSTEAEPIAHLEAADISQRDYTEMADGRGLLVGTPVDQIQIRIQNSEIQVSGPHVNSGYLDDAHNVENKIVEGDTIWHRTGDTGQFDEMGRLWLSGRLGTDVLTGNVTLFPFSIEVAARFWPGVKHCALMVLNDQATLVVQGDIAHLHKWEKSAQPFGVTHIKTIGKIPMDARHGSKIDRTKLAEMLS